LKRAVKDSAMPEAVAAWGPVQEKLNFNKTFQRTLKTAAELHIICLTIAPKERLFKFGWLTF